MSETPAGPGRRGAAVFAAVLLMLALTALGHGMLVLAREELGAARAGARVLAERAAAQAAALLVAEVPLPPEAVAAGLWRAVPAGSGALGAVTYRAGALRLSREVWLARGEAWTASGGPGEPEGGARATRAVWVPEPVARVAAFGAVLSVAEGSPVTLAGDVDGGAVHHTRAPLDPAACAPWAAALDSLIPSSSLPALASHARDGERPRLGLIGRDSLLARLRVEVTGSGSPAPETDGAACLAEAPWSWGDPENPLRPCGQAVAVRVARGDLVVDGGAGQALLVVEGDLVLRGGARIYGGALVGGVLRVIEGAVLAGLASAESGVEVGSSSEVVGSTCWAARAMAAATRELSRPVAVPGAGWIGPL